LHGNDLGRVLQAWGFAPSATSERFRLQVDGNWPGSPAAVRLANFSGTLEADLRNGRFSELQGSASALRVFGLLNLDAIGRPCAWTSPTCSAAGSAMIGCGANCWP